MELEHTHIQSISRLDYPHTHNVNGYKDLLTHRHTVHPQDVACIELGSLDDRREYHGRERRFPDEA